MSLRVIDISFRRQVENKFYNLRLFSPGNDNPRQIGIPGSQLALTPHFNEFWGYKYIPETKGITLEKIEDEWRKGTKPNQIGK